MIQSHRVLNTILLLLVAVTTLAQTKTPPRKRRADSFFGLHFDFHASMSDSAIGKTLTEGMIDSMLVAVKPDYIQVDSKGHAGVSSYPTRVGHAPKRFVRNPLRLFRDVTARRGVALYVHHSGVWDDQAVKNHPNWARIKPDGKPDEKKASLWSSYVDSLLIPQLKEISDYGIDGVWIDGDCWAVEPDYGRASVAAFERAGGSKTTPQKVGDAGFEQFLEQQRTAFKRYVARYTNALHEYNPRFQVASNWAFSSFMPEPVSLPVDFISGDTDPLDGANRSAFQARCIAPQGKPWDLMSWSFGFGWKDQVATPKPAVQLCQEAAQVISLGGGFQSYWPQNNDASLKPWNIPTMAEIARFCRARQPFCQGAKAVPQVALLYSGFAQRARSYAAYNFDADLLGNLIGTLNSLLYSQFSTEILMEHHLHGRMNQYPLIVIPEWQTLPDTFRTELVQYVKQGGNLLVMGHQTVRLFGNELGVKMDQNERSVPGFGIDDVLTGIRASYQPFTPLPGTRTMGSIYNNHDKRFPVGPLASVAKLGKGSIAGIYVNIGDAQSKRETHVGRRVIASVARAIFEPQVEVKGSQFAHVVLNRKNGKTMLNLINMAGTHGNKAVFSTDEIPPIGPLTVTYRTPTRPGRLTLQPNNTPVPFTYKNGVAAFTIPSVAIHSIVVAE